MTKSLYNKLVKLQKMQLVAATFGATEFTISLSTDNSIDVSLTYNECSREKRFSESIFIRATLSDNYTEEENNEFLKRISEFISCMEVSEKHKPECDYVASVTEE